MTEHRGHATFMEIELYSVDWEPMEINYDPMVVFNIAPIYLAVVKQN